MNLDTAEPAILDPAREPAARALPIAHGPGRLAPQGPAPGTVMAARGRPLERLRADPARMAAVRDVWLALWSSRLLVWIAGVAAAGAAGFGPVRHALDPPGVTRGLGRLGDLLAAPAARWDAAWYLVIAHYGYRPDLGAFTAPRAAFFPLYPFGLSGLAHLGLPPVLAGAALSIGAMAAALYGLHRLTTLELRRDAWAGAPPRMLAGARALGWEAVEERTRRAARVVVLLTAFGPMAFYLSAVYSESLYLALSVGVFLFARRGRWGLACVCASLAGVTRNTGLMLAVPLVLLYLYGPREDRLPDRPLEQPWPGPARMRPGLGGRWMRSRMAGLLRTLAPRYRVRREARWLALVPVGVVLYMAHLGLAGGGMFLPLHAQAVWDRHFAGPYFGVWDGAGAAFEGARQLLSLQRTHVYFGAAGGSPFIDAGHNLMLFAFLLAALPALVGVLRRMPVAYGAYVLGALALPLSYPVAPQPLMSLPRFLVVLFPLNMWLGERLTAHASPRTRGVALAVSAIGMAFFTAEFATWHWVA